MSEWSVMVHLYHISKSHNKKNVLLHINYLLRSKECLSYFSTTHNEKDKDAFLKKEKEIWSLLNSKENRKNSRLQSRMIVPLPNSFGEKEAKEVFDNIVGEFKKHNKNIHMFCAFHAGYDRYNSRNQKLNKHLHIVYSIRDVKTFKKIRSLNSRELLNNIKGVVSNTIQKYVVVNNNRMFDLKINKKINRNAFQKYLRTKEISDENLRIYLELKNIQKMLFELFDKKRKLKKLEELEEKKKIDDEIKKILQEKQLAYKQLLSKQHQHYANFLKPEL